MKCVGIIGAMEQEVARLKEVMENVSITTRAGMDFYEGVLEGKKVVVVQSGIGKVNAGMCTQILADLFQVEAVINTGIAGSLNNDINIGDIVLSTDVLHHEWPSYHQEPTLKLLYLNFPCLSRHYLILY